MSAAAAGAADSQSKIAGLSAREVELAIVAWRAIDSGDTAVKVREKDSLTSSSEGFVFWRSRYLLRYTFKTHRSKSCFNQLYQKGKVSSLSHVSLLLSPRISPFSLLDSFSLWAMFAVTDWTPRLHSLITTSSPSSAVSRMPTAPAPPSMP